MKDLNSSTLAKGIFYNKKTGLCIFETNIDKIKWHNVHIDNISGKFYQKCPAVLYKYDNELLKAVILKTKKKEKIKKLSVHFILSAVKRLINSTYKASL